MDKLDLGSFNFDLTPTISVAQHIDNHFEEQQRILNNISEMHAKRDATIMAGAEASVAQKELLEQQLDEIKTQNDILAEQLKEELLQKGILEEHLRVATEQNGLLSNNYKKLEEMYNAQKESYEDAREDLKKSRTFNAWMMVIAIVAMLAAIAGPIATILVSR